MAANRRRDRCQRRAINSAKQHIRLTLINKWTRLRTPGLEWLKMDASRFAGVRSVGMERMWGVILIALAVAGALGYLAACIWLFRLYRSAPTGYQDQDGFHLGHERYGRGSPANDLRHRARAGRRHFGTAADPDAHDGSRKGKKTHAGDKPIPARRRSGAGGTAN